MVLEMDAVELWYDELRAVSDHLDLRHKVFTVGMQGWVGGTRVLVVDDGIVVLGMSGELGILSKEGERSS